MELSKKLSDKLKDLPEKSGVYIMRDAGGHIIYIGKAVVLKNRVRQYFFNTQKEERVRAMAASVADFDYIITLTEKDALSLEANLIRKHKPHYNILLKDDRHSPYIRIDLKQKFPYIEVTRKIKNDGAKYFGPYFFGVRVQEVIEVIKSAYRMRCCPKNFFSHKRGCLNYHINLCLAPCSGNVTEEDYRAAVDKVVAFLSGKDSEAEKIIGEKMAAAAESEEFERAIRYRDQLEMLKRLKERTLSELQSGSKDLDAVSFVSDGVYGAVSVVLVRGGKMMGARNYAAGGAATGADAVTQFLTQYYADSNVEVPPEILLDTEFDASALEEYLFGLSGKKTAVSFPVKGFKYKLVKMAEENARDYLVKSLDRNKRDYELCEGALERLSEMLGIPYLKRIECYDISHLSGTEQVASGVAFLDGRPFKSGYRRYKIRTVEGSDDFKALAEAVGRRLERAKLGDEKFSELPDLMLIDGGKGQLGSAYAAMKACGMDIPMIALAEKNEEIYTLDSPEPIVLGKESFPLRLLQRVRDEAHRFAVSFHRNLRAKKYGSVLEQIPSVGPKKRQILLKAFSSARAVEEATAETLAAIEGIDRKTAEMIVQFFQEKNNKPKNPR